MPASMFVSAIVHVHHHLCRQQSKTVQPLHYLPLSLIEHSVHNLQSCHCAIHLSGQVSADLVGHVCTSYVCSGAVHSPVTTHWRGCRLRTANHQQLHSQHATAEHIQLPKQPQLCKRPGSTCFVKGTLPPGKSIDTSSFVDVSGFELNS